VSDIDTAAADGLKVLDPKRPITEADIASAFISTRLSQTLARSRVSPKTNSLARIDKSRSGAMR
jgi:hypothetical protein